jgi:hypothetical protein
MRYLCLVYLDDEKLGALPKAEHDALVTQSIAYDEELGASGHLVSADALEDAAASTTLRVRGGRLSVTDGPFVETKEQLGGFVLIEARDLNEAMQLAAKIPPARYGSIVVRPVRHLTAP